MIVSDPQKHLSKGKEEKNGGKEGERGEEGRKAGNDEVIEKEICQVPHHTEPEDCSLEPGIFLDTWFIGCLNCSHRPERDSFA